MYIRRLLLAIKDCDKPAALCDQEAIYFQNHPSYHLEENWDS